MKLIVALRARDRDSENTDKSARSATRRLSKIKASIEQMRAKLKRDLRSSDPSRFLTALAVAVLDETGQDAIGAKKKHVRFGEDDESDNTSVMMKVQKGRGSHVANPMVVKALRDAFEAIDDDNDDLFRHDMGQVSAEAVSDYLTAFNLNSEKLRGYNSNAALQRSLTALRAKGGELPRHSRSRQKVLRGEFQKALTDTVNSFGLDENMVRAKYLLPGLEASYLKDGSFGVREASANVPFSIENRVLIRILM